MTPLWVPVVTGVLGVVVGVLLVVAVGVAAAIDEAHQRLSDEAEMEDDR